MDDAQLEKSNPEACARCGLRKVTHDLQLQGITFRFCDECYWGSEKEPALKAQS